jgi:hypothetical protein
MLCERPLNVICKIFNGPASTGLTEAISAFRSRPSTLNQAAKERFTNAAMADIRHDLTPFDKLPTKSSCDQL